jgi:hypothetical protein
MLADPPGGWARTGRAEVPLSVEALVDVLAEARRGVELGHFDPKTSPHGEAVVDAIMMGCPYVQRRLHGLAAG